MAVNKARFWWAVLYPENMVENWENKLDDMLQLPFAYCMHFRDKDLKSEHRKDHIHLIIVFPNTTTYNHAMEIFSLLSAEGKRAVNTCQAINNIRHAYDYLIHDTDKCREKKKEQYDPSERITGNNFDIGAYEQLGVVEINEIKNELRIVIRSEGFTNYMDFLDCVEKRYEDSNYMKVAMDNHSLFEKMTRSNFQKWQTFKEYGVRNVRYLSKSVLQEHEKQHENNTKTTRSCDEICCPECGSVDVKKHGKTASLSQRWQCNDCGKTFIF